MNNIENSVSYLKGQQLEVQFQTIEGAKYYQLFDVTENFAFVPHPVRPI